MTIPYDLAALVQYPYRDDIYYPGPGVSDRGRTVGCRGLRRIPPAKVGR